ncbi:LPXTG cell wall anchor domain-containing protein [Jiangella ureilytica]|uniref:LPXTG cell wall anchor domain-containing protein n=1 Tax=Jiangella ureilytica TaxID=2530374 RepID=UPI0010501AEE|nr:LPXTG cell wall anchor domain-containing protein [Jiangella ureilytica]
MGVVILATGGLAGTAAAASGTGPEGQTITVSKVDGLDPAGETITVHGEGYDLTKGIYVVVCVNNGAGQQPTPCLGGADMEGGGGASAWISSNPPSYGEGLATPFEEVGGKGSFDVQLSVAASDEFTDCLDTAQAPDGCVVGTRADHTRTADRSADVLIPITFADAGSGGDDGSDGNDAGGQGEAGPTPKPSSTTAAGGGSNLARTGASIIPAALAGLALLGGGGAAVAIRRRRTEETNRP